MKCFLNVVSIQHNFFAGYIKKIHIASMYGMLNIYPKHTALLSKIQPGVLYIVTNCEKKIYMYISHGILEVQPMLINIVSKKIILGINLNYNTLIKKKKQIKIQIEKYPNKLSFLKYDLYKINIKLKIINLMNKNS